MPASVTVNHVGCCPSQLGATPLLRIRFRGADLIGVIEKLRKLGADATATDAVRPCRCAKRTPTLPSSSAQGARAQRLVHCG